uniref:DDE superfamily endonuclease n=2 Tax=Candidatus Kentrum sp. LPFa TaxID=2126335 RepID=A0A450XFS7_9GAMM|nr:MAG: DDE superfamily endonuclease [Candidatus Kentron sp. LPFa]
MSNDVQKEFYSGKRKTHTIKNNLVIGIEDRQIKYLGGTHEGKKHDKKICDEEEIKCPKNSVCYRDNGFQGYEMEGIDIREPKKKPRNGELTEEEKNNNKLISSLRVIVEHVISGAKRCRIVKDVFRNTKLGYDDLAMEIACGLHNYRSHFRLASY